MDERFQIITKACIIIIHIVAVILITLTILFSEDLLLLFAIIVCQSIVFLQLIVFDGCLVSKYEFGLGSDYSVSDIGKKLFFLSDDLPCSDFEKMIVGIPLLICVMKFCMMLLPKTILSAIQNDYMSFARLKIPRGFEIEFDINNFDLSVKY
jgi:hypothetical protein